MIKDLSMRCLVPRRVALRTTPLRLRSNLYPRDLTDLHNQGWAKAENMILILPVWQRGTRVGE